MKILELLFSLGSGGAERFVVDLSNEMSCKHDVVLMTLKDDAIDNREFYKDDLNSSIKYVNLGLKDGFSITSLIIVYKKIKQLKPDIVHIHIAFRYCLLPILFYDKAKYFLTIHNEIKGWYTNNLNRFLFNCFGLFKRVTFVTISKTNYDDFNREYGRCSNYLIYNGRKKELESINFEKVTKDVSNLKKTTGSLIFLHVARCARQKNQRMLINSFNRFVENGGDAILLILGRDYDNTDLGRELMKSAGDNIYFLGEKLNVQDYIINCDALVLTSLYEGMPITIIEALQNGKPIISTPVCGVIDVVNNGKNGYISEDFSEESFCNALENFVRERKRYFDETNYLDSKKMFDIKECANKYESLFKFILG